MFNCIYYRKGQVNSWNVSTDKSTSMTDVLIAFCSTHYTHISVFPATSILCILSTWKKQQNYPEKLKQNYTMSVGWMGTSSSATAKARGTRWSRPTPKNLSPKSYRAKQIHHALHLPEPKIRPYIEYPTSQPLLFLMKTPSTTSLDCYSNTKMVRIPSHQG